MNILLKNNRYILFLIALNLILVLSPSIELVNAQTPTPQINTPLPYPSNAASPQLNLEATITTLETKVGELEKKVEKPPKDIWDKINSISGLLSGLLIALLGAIATYVYREREIRIREIQTIQGFMPQLQSGNPKAVYTAILAISALGNSRLATQLASLYQTDAAVSALARMATSSDQLISQQAEISLGNVIKNIREISPLDRRDAIISAEDLFVGGIYLRTFIQIFRSLLIERINAGARIRLLLLDPNSSDVESVATEREANTVDIRNRILSTLNEIEDIRNEINPSKSGSMKVHLLNKVPSFTFTLSNQHKSDGKLLIEFRTFSSGINGPQMIISKSNKLFDVFVESCEKLWSVSIEVPSVRQ